ncbi:hypothetical protein [uncultured Draconibacterium sp.]|uniref:hypothetical protein n=1 Tax=uncultured Draconibacterium sp. TaxID=1573823 RepID=UPI0029C70B37|nr:hypothetical protein [uncultured Draconibacterium sp.]
MDGIPFRNGSVVEFMQRRRIRPSELYTSNDNGTNWQLTDLAYRPQGIDRENNLIADSQNEIQKLENGKWTAYTWDASSEPLVSIGLKYEGMRGNDTEGRRMDDFEFDAANNLYAIGKNTNTICRTRLN